MTPLDGSLLSLQWVEELDALSLDFGHGVVNVDSRLFGGGGIGGIVGGRRSFGHDDDQTEGVWLDVVCDEGKLKIEGKGRGFEKCSSSSYSAGKSRLPQIRTQTFCM